MLWLVLVALYLVILVLIITPMILKRYVETILAGAELWV